MDTMYDKWLQERLASLRIKKGNTSAREMSLSLGLNVNYVNNIESGKSLPSMYAFFDICEYLNISPRDFFDESTDYPQQLNQLIDDLKKLDERQLKNVAELIHDLAAASSEK